MDKAEARLKECLDEILEEEIMLIPEKAELKRLHKFSRHFERNMENMIKQNKKRKVFRAYKAFGACAAVFVLGIIAVKQWSPLHQRNAISYEEKVQESAEMSEESVTDAATDTYDASEGEMSLGDSSWEKSGYGDEVNVAGIKAVPVGLKIIADFQQKNGRILYQQLQNNSDHTIQFMEGSYMLEVWKEDGWYVMETNEDGRVYELAAESRYAGDILLESQLYPEEKYRVLLMIDGEMKGYVFQVEE